MNSGMKMLVGIGVGMFLLGMVIAFAWADGGLPAGVAAMQ